MQVINSFIEVLKNPDHPEFNKRVRPFEVLLGLPELNFSSWRSSAIIALITNVQFTKEEADTIFPWASLAYFLEFIFPRQSTQSFQI
jgi:hypothetical protein